VLTEALLPSSRGDCGGRVNSSRLQQASLMLAALVALPLLAPRQPQLPKRALNLGLPLGRTLRRARAVPLSRPAMNTSFQKRESWNKGNSFRFSRYSRSLTDRSCLIAGPVGQGCAG
jgi:hypothetical protein